MNPLKIKTLNLRRWRPSKSIKSVFTLGLGVLLFTGCVNVKPWQRGALADITMRSDRDPLGERFAEHTFFSREASTGGRGVGGGGCGCN